MDGEFSFYQNYGGNDEEMLMISSFVSPDIQKKYDLDLPEYPGIDQVVEVANNGEKL